MSTPTPTWFSKDLGDGVQAYAPRLQIMDAFMPMFAVAGCPIDMAVFSRYDLRTNVVTIYFSPRASELAKMFGATPCEQPIREDFSLSVGDVRAWEHFYPAAQKNQ
jgi:hypothetical protein